MEMLSQNILPIKYINADSDKWGGKASFLGIIAKYEFFVPNGICLSTSIFTDYLVNLRLHTQNSFLSELGDFVEYTLAKQNLLNKSLIIRSSSNFENSSEYSGTGIFESFIYSNDEPIANIIRSVWDQVSSKKCKKFLDTFRIDEQAIRMGVLIQQIAIGVFSGVIQTEENFEGHSKCIIIEFEYFRIGAVVDGEKQSFLLILDEENKIVINNNKELTARQIEILIKLIIHIRKVFYSPVEFEFVLDHEKIWIVQVRYKNA